MTVDKIAARKKLCQNSNGCNRTRSIPPVVIDRDGSGGSKSRSFEGALPSGNGSFRKEPPKTTWRIVKSIDKGDAIDWRMPSVFQITLLIPYALFLVTLGFLWGSHACLPDLKRCREYEAEARLLLKQAMESCEVHEEDKWDFGLFSS
jgi:hypothetical protein